LSKNLDLKSGNSVVAIIVAAGRGRRLKSNQPKPFVKICAKPILFYILSVFSAQHLIKEIILVCNRRSLSKARSLVKVFKFNKVKKIVLGGALRRDSVANGLKPITGDKNTFVLIHDAARPFINNSYINELIRHAFKYNAVISAVPVKFTTKSARIISNKLFVDKTLERKKLWEIQTPQIFRSDLIKKAYSHFGHIEATDDSSLVELLGAKVKIVSGSYSNIKITTPEDLAQAKIIAEKFSWKA
jgi:2-C-methyl-D-erythritol 4-phosphate cytidylyltransferase